MRGKDGPKFKYTPETMEKKLNDYFEKTPVDEITLTGVCIHLGIYKDTFYNYGKRDGASNQGLEIWLQLQDGENHRRLPEQQ